MEENLSNISKPLRCGLVHNWPGARNSELDIIIRVGRVLEDLGHEWHIIDPRGRQLNGQAQFITDEHSPLQGLDLVLNFHYLNPRFPAALSYVVNWNPLAYVLDDPSTGLPVPRQQLDYVFDCLRSHDRVLSAGSEALDAYALSVRGQGARDDLPAAEPLSLHTTIQSGEHDLDLDAPLDVSASDCKVFYIGNNWEKVSESRNKKIRHEGLFEVLDETGLFEFYGVREQNGVYLWEGIQSYRGELPFDGGRSILGRSRECGISLVLSSQQHRDSAVVSTRIFQACASGTVVISDRNPFVEREFGDSVFFFDYGESPRETAENILSALEWIRSHWAEALQRAGQCRARFLEKFALESEVSKIVLQCQHDLAHLERRARDAAGCRVHVHYLVRQAEPVELERFVDNITRQNHPNLGLILYVSPGDQDRVAVAVNALSADSPLDIITLPLHQLRLGHTMSLVAGRDDFHLWYSEGFSWHPDHVDLLLSRAQSASSGTSYTPMFTAYDHMMDEKDSSLFFLAGLGGGFSRITRRSLTCCDMLNLPVGNVLFSGDTIRAVRDKYSLLAVLDLGAIALVLWDSCLDAGASLGYTNAITSDFKLYERYPTYEGYYEYPTLPDHWHPGKERDANIISSFSGRSEPIVDENAEFFGAIANESRLDRVASIEYVSSHFSLIRYLELTLRGFPRLRKVLTGTLRWLARPRG